MGSRNFRYGEIAELARRWRISPLTFRHSGGMTAGRPLGTDGSMAPTTTCRKCRGLGNRLASPTALESAPSRSLLLAVHGTVVNFVNMETSQLYEDGNFKNFF